MTYEEVFKQYCDLRDEQEAVNAAIRLMRDTCPLRGYYLPGSGADYARRTLGRLEDRDSVISKELLKIANAMMQGQKDN